MRNVEYIISLRDRFSKKLSTIQKRTSVFQSSIGKVGGAIGLAFGGVMAVRGIKNLLELGGKLELIDKKAKIVFGSYEAQIKSFAQTNAAAMGLTQSELIESAAAIGDLLIPMGIQRDVATDMTQRIVSLSGALSEWTGGQRSAMEVGKVLAKALLGEREQLKELGVSIMESDVQLELMSRGMNKLTGNALKQARAMITVDMLYQRTQDAQTSYASGAGSLVRIKAELIAKLKTYRDILAIKLIPIFKKVIDKVGKVIILFEKHKDILIPLGKGILVVIGVLATLKIAIWAVNAAMAANPIGAVILAMSALVALIIYAKDQFGGWAELWEGVKIQADMLFGGIGDIFISMGDIFMRVIEKIKANWRGLMAVIKGEGTMADLGRELRKIDKFFERRTKVREAARFVRERKYAIMMRKVQAGKGAGMEGVSAIGGGLGAGLGAGAGITPAGAGLGAGLAGVTAGAPKTFNINIEKLVGIEEFITNNVKQGINQMGEEIKKQLLIALRDTQIIAG